MNPVFGIVLCGLTIQQGVSTDELVDRTGRRFSKPEILRMGVERFEKEYDSRHYDIVDLYRRVVEDSNDQIISSLSTKHQRRFRRLRGAVARLDKAVMEICYDLCGGGTHLHYNELRLAAAREDHLRSLLLGHRALSSPSVPGQQLLYFTRLEMRLHRIRVELAKSNPAEFPPVRRELHGKHLNEFAGAIRGLRSACGGLPVREPINHVLRVLDKYD